MSRFVTISFYIMCFMFSMTFLHQINMCYEHGSLVEICPVEPGMGRPMIPFEINPLFGYTFRDANNNIINASDPSSYNDTMRDVASYNPAPSGITEVMGFFSWVLAGGRLMINAFVMPIVGFPGFMQKFWIPAIATYPIGALLFLIQIIGIYEFFSGREIFKK